MKAIALLNEKGGIAKTTTATNLAAGLAHYGHRTLIVDFDPQGHVAVRLGIKPDDSVYYVFKGEKKWTDIVYKIPREFYGNTEDDYLYLLPGSSLSREFAINLSVGKIVTFLREASQFFDFVIFDTSPQLGAVHTSLIAACDYLIIPTEGTRLSIRGLMSTINHYHLQKNNKVQVEQLRAAGIKIAEIMGILPTRFNGRKSVHYQNLGFLDGRYGENIHIFEPIRLLTDWEKAEAKVVPVFMYNPRSEAAQEALSFVNEVLQLIERGSYEATAQ